MPMMRRRSGYLATAVLAGSLAAACSAQGLPASVHVDDHRPLMKAGQLLQDRYGVPISFEDASAYEYEGELKELDNFAELKRIHPDMKRILFPNGSLDVSFSEPENTATPAGVGKILRDLLAQHVENGNPARFGLLETSESLVIVPTARKNSAGALVSDRSPLELRISFPEADRTAGEGFDVFCQALTQALGKTVGLWSNVLDWQQRATVGANNEVARVVLLRIIANLRFEGAPPQAVRPRVSYVFGPNVGLDSFRLSVRQVAVKRPDRYGRLLPIMVPRTGPLDMNRPALADIPSLRR
jgi:hypothetical protein